MSAPDTALHFQNALGIGRAIRQGTLTSRQAATHFLDRIERAGALNAQRGHGRARAGRRTPPTGCWQPASCWARCTACRWR